MLYVCACVRNMLLSVLCIYLCQCKPTAYFLFSLSPTQMLPAYEALSLGVSASSVLNVVVVMLVCLLLLVEYGQWTDYRLYGLASRRMCAVRHA